MTISKTTVKWLLVEARWEKRLYIGETLNFENMRLTQDNLSITRFYKSIWTHQHWSIRKANTFLPQIFQIISCELCIANIPRCQIEYLITII